MREFPDGTKKLFQNPPHDDHETGDMSERLVDDERTPQAELAAGCLFRKDFWGLSPLARPNVIR